jgi:DNA mismatch repair protein MutL
VLKPFDFDDLIVKGVIFDTYILATDADSFYMIDQHAAHERIFYEKLVSEYENGEKLRQPMFVPILINVDISTKIQDSDWLDILSKMGFAIESFGQNSYRVSEIPTFMEISEAEDFLKDFTDGINDSFSRRNTVVINKLIMKSCKSAVKANDKLAPEEIAALIKDLKNCTNPFSCPHGRPTFIKLSKYEIERLFKRA